MTHLNQKLYTDLPIDEMDEQLAVEELEERLELSCWNECNFCTKVDPICNPVCIKIITPPLPCNVLL